MAGERLSMQQEIHRRRRGGGFFGRRDELAVFAANLDTDPGDEAHHFLFHVHGPGGVGKTTLLGQFARAAGERGALTAQVNEDAMTVPATMAALSAGLAEQDRPLKAFDRLYAVYQQRRHEADVQGAAGAASPSAGSTVVAQAGLAGLGMLPGLGAVAGAVDPGQLAGGLDRLRAAGSLRFRNEQDLHLLMDPVAALSPVFTADLASAAAGARWLTLFFDSYERTGPVLGGWLRELFVDGRYGALPANVVVTLAGQGALDRAGWADLLDFVTPLPLGPFTEAEARQLLAARGITDEDVIEVVLRLTDGLPLLVSTLAAARPSGPEAVGDPAETAVERFLSWEQDTAGRAAALAAALPLHLDEDVYRVAVADDAPKAADHYDWLRGLPFVDERGGQARYHDIVRGQMLRLRRTRSPQRWRDQHERLAAAYGSWRERAGHGRSGGELWADETWHEYRLQECYHLLCADHRAALPDTLLNVARACTTGADAARSWIRMLTGAAADAGAEELAHWAHALAEVYGDADVHGAAAPGSPVGRGAVVPAARSAPPAAVGAPLACTVPGGDAFAGDAARAVQALGVILEQGELDRSRRAVAYAIRAWTHRQAGDPQTAFADYDRAERLGLATFLLYSERGTTHWTLGRPEDAAADYARALAADPGDPLAPTVRAQRAGALLQAGRPADAMTDLDAVIAADPQHAGALTVRAMTLLRLDRAAEALLDAEECVAAVPHDADSLGVRGLIHQRLGNNAEALADFDDSLALRPGSAAWVFAGRGLALEALGRYADAADSLTRAVGAAGRPDNATLTHCARLLRLAGRPRQALTAADRACAQDPEDPGPVKERALSLVDAGLLPEAADAFGRLLELQPAAADALIARARVHVRIGRPAAALEDFRLLAELGPVPEWYHGRRAQLLVLAGDPAAAREALDRAGPRTLDDLLTLAVCHREEGRYDEAAAVLGRAEDLAPGHGGAALERALLTALADGFPAARPRWLALRAAGESGCVPPAVWRTMIACGLGEWADAEIHLTALLATSPAWPIRAVLARDIAALAASPTAPRSAAFPLLTRLPGQNS